MSISALIAVALQLDVLRIHMHMCSFTFLTFDVSKVLEQSSSGFHAI